MSKLKRRPDMDQMAEDVIQLISDFDGIAINENLEVKITEKPAEKKGYCLLF